MLAKFTSIFLLAASVVAQVTIQTPASLIECEPTALIIGGGTAPYIIDALPGGQVSAAALENIGTAQSAGTFTWDVNLAAGTNVTIRVTDNTGTIGYSAPVVVQSGTDTSCVSSSGSISQIGASSTASVVSSISSSASSFLSSASSSSASAASSVSSELSSISSSVASQVSSIKSSVSSAAATGSTSSAPSSSASGSSGSTSGAEAFGVKSAVIGLFVAVGVFGGMML